MSNFTKVMWLVCPSLMALLLFGAWQCSKNPGQPEEPVEPIVIENPWAVTVPDPAVEDYATFTIERRGRYEITSRVLYEPASELNESFFLLIFAADNGVIFPEEGNAGMYYVVRDEHNAGFEYHVKSCGVFDFLPGEYEINIVHLSDLNHPELVNPPMGENESVAGDGFTLTCVD